MTQPSVGIVGGGILGLSAAYRLAQQGVQVTLFERAPDLGGLVGSFDFAGRPVDRFYHVILPTDHRVLGLAEELGLRDTFRFRPTRVGFYLSATPRVQRLKYLDNVVQAPENHSGRYTPSRISDDLYPRGHVARRCYPPAQLCMSLAPARA